MDNNIIRHPGKIISEELERIKMSQMEFSVRTGIKNATLTKIINGEANLTSDICKKLAMYFNTPIETWMNYQTKYDESLIDKETLKNIDKEYEIVKMFDKDFLKKVCNKKTNLNNKVEVVENLREVFMVNNLTTLKTDDIYNLGKAFKDKEFSEKDLVFHNAYISYAMYLAKFHKTFTFDYKNNTQLVEELKKLSFEYKNQLYAFMEKLNKYGIKLMILPTLKESKITSFIRLSPLENCVVIAVNDHSDDAYDLWFNVLSELSHTYKIHNKLLSITYDDTNDSETIRFANYILIDPDEYEYFTSLHDFSIKAIELFSKRVNVNKFIIIGRLKKDKFIPKKALPKDSLTYKI